MPLTSPVHPPSDSAVYFPSGKPGVSLSPSPACPPDARSKMTGTDWFTEELAVRPPFSLTCNPHPGEAGCLQQASKSPHTACRREDSRGRSGPAPRLGLPTPEPGWIRRTTPMLPFRRGHSVGSGPDRRSRSRWQAHRTHRGALYQSPCRRADFLLPLTGDKCGQGKRKAISSFRLASARSYPEGCSTETSGIWACKALRCSGSRARGN